MHSPLARERKLQSPWQRWQEDQEWRKTNTNLNTSFYSPKGFHSDQKCLQLISPHKLPLTSPGFEQKYSGTNSCCSFGKFVGQGKKKKKSRWTEIQLLLCRPWLTSSLIPGPSVYFRSTAIDDGCVSYQ